MQMNWLKLIPSGFLLMAACAGFPLPWRTERVLIGSERLQDVALVQQALRHRMMDARCLPACSISTPSEASPQEMGEVSESEKTPGRVRLEFQDVHYDGVTLSGRLLIGVEEGRLRLNRQLHPDLQVEVRSPVDCQTGLPVRFIVWDGFPPRLKEDLLILDKGYWFGRAVDFSLFDERLTGAGPECLKAELWLFSFDGAIAARQEIRAEKSPRQPGDAGMPEHPADAGPQE